MSMIKEKRGIQKCRLCRNHGIDVIRFGHSPCQFEQDHLDSFGEPCLDCKNTKERRQKSAREIQRKRKFSCFLNEHCSSDETHGKQRKEKQCRKCRVHGVVSKFGKKHLEMCYFNNCLCSDCIDIDSLRKSSRFEVKYSREIFDAVMDVKNELSQLLNTSHESNNTDMNPIYKQMNLNNKTLQ